MPTLRIFTHYGKAHDKHYNTEAIAKRAYAILAKRFDSCLGDIIEHVWGNDNGRPTHDIKYVAQRHSLNHDWESML